MWRGQGRSPYKAHDVYVGKSLKANDLGGVRTVNVQFCFNWDLVLSPVSVRDAAARLPNGEGTRAEICELLKDSQFLAPDVTSAQVSSISREHLISSFTEL